MEETDLELAKKRVQARMGLIIHVTLYALVNGALALIWWATGARYPWFLWPMFGWGIGIVGHLLGYFFGPGSLGEQRAVSRELRRLRERTH